MLVSGIVLVLYFWVFFIGTGNVTAVLFVPDFAAIAAGISFISAIIAYLWTPRTLLLRSALATFALLLSSVVILVISTGGMGSPFIVLWMLAAVFAAVFGWYGVALVSAMPLSYAGWLAYTDSLALDQLLLAGFITIIPVIVGLFSWWHNGLDNDSEDRAYHELASELSSVSGQSEIVIAAIADGVISLNKAGKIQLINPAAQSLIGWGKADALGLDYSSVLKITDNRNQSVTPLNDPVRQAIDTNTQQHTEALSLSTSDSKKKFLAAITATPLGSLGSGVIVVFRDITKEKSEEREQAEFISTASHEMRTPVASIEGYLGLALNPQTATIDEKAREYIGKAQEAATHLGRLFQDLLDVSKADDGRLANNPKVVDVVPFVHDIILGLLPKATEKHLIISYKPMPDLYADTADDKPGGHLSPVFYVNVDNDHLREVVANLIENAIKYTLAGDITIDVTGDEKSVEISIKDSGIGIPKEDISHLFQKFYRVDNSATREIGGTGLGLYLSRKLTEAMGGQIWVESEYQQGSTFFVKLARIDHAEARQLIEQASIAAEKEQAQQAAPPAIGEVDAPKPLVSAQSAAPPEPTPVAAPVAAPDPPVAPPKPLNLPQARANPNSAPVYNPSSKPNTSLSEIERSPRQYVRPINISAPTRTPPDASTK